jgi:hypothetical protein
MQSTAACSAADALVRLKDRVAALEGLLAAEQTAKQAVVAVSAAAFDEGCEVCDQTGCQAAVYWCR